MTVLIQDVSDIQSYKGNVLSSLQRFIATSIDEKMNRLFGFLLEKTVKPYLFLLGKWLYFGILEDMHEEFFVRLNPEAVDQVGWSCCWGFWGVFGLLSLWIFGVFLVCGC